jgi:phenylacetate-CoA ligase
MAQLAELERSQWRSPAELEAEQGRALEALVAHAYRNVPYYRQLMDARGIAPGELRSVADLRRLPILTRDVAARAGESRRSTGEPRCVVDKLTGGSTGAPLRFGFDLGSEHWRHAIKLRGWGWSGYRVGDRTLYFWGPATTLPPPFSKRAKVAADRALKRERYIDCTERGEAELSAVVGEIRARRIERLICYTQAGVDLARFIVERRLRDWDDVPVLCCAEALHPADRRLFEQAFGPEVVETYGCREVMMIACECEAHDGLHTSMENLIVEVVVRDGDEERPARPGEQGEVVITDLHNYGMPFIRYANGDLAALGPEARCRCGRGLARLASVDGRVAETLRAADGAPVCGILFSRIFSWSDALARTVQKWQVVQHLDGSLTIKLMARGDVDAEAHADLRRSLERYLKDVPYRTELVGEIPPAKNGKQRTVIVER